MKKTIGFFKANYFLIHPLLFALYPILALYAHNIIEIHISTIYRSLALTLLGTILLFYVAKRAFKNAAKASLFTTLCTLSFFSYGHVYNAAENVNGLGFNFARHRFLAPTWFLVFFIAIVILSRMNKPLSGLIGAVNIAAIIINIFPAYQIIYYHISTQRIGIPPVLAQQFNLPSGQGPPDIYYIILDAYGRDDALLEDHGFNNSSFLKALEDQGFFIGYCSRSNYNHTKTSLLTSLNMDYAGNLIDIDEVVQANKRGGFGVLIKQSAVRQILEGLGYKIIAFETGFNWTEIEDADVFLKPPAIGFAANVPFVQPNKFDILLARTSGVVLLMEGSPLFDEVVSAGRDQIDDKHRQRVLFTLDQLEQMPSTPGPKFVFAHIVSPHPPFVFGPEGQEALPGVPSKVSYINQVSYLNERVEDIVKQILANSDVPPIIIIQGDHGSSDSVTHNRLKILNAYYLPGRGNANLYPGISPVNTFRIVLNMYFGGNLPLLEDLSYFSAFEYDYEFTPILENRAECILN